ncbi:major outer membrane protein [Campylobacter sp. CCS1377]|uniref:Major outer membrane protein n=1 Tax=Campylobacter sp. CCS1377 TaxID=3158229 RepID=A0AAU7E8H1_9BACT
MKKLKLSLCATLVLFTNSYALPLEEAIKDVDISGVLRYRYDSASGDYTRGFTDEVGAGYIKDKQTHNYKTQINFGASIADNFKAFIQLSYTAKDGGFGANSVSSTQDTLNVRQLYLTYTNENLATSIIAGKQQLNTIWTDNSIDGLVGTGIKVFNNSFDGLTLSAFVFDSFGIDEQEGDLWNDGHAVFNANGKILADLFGENLYGVAALGSYKLGEGSLNSQIWLSYLNDNALFYAADISYDTLLFNHVNWKLEGAYLGNHIDNSLKDHLGFDDGNLFVLKGSIEVYGWDASLGGVYYGDDKALTIQVLEDKGNLDLGGEEIFYTDGSKLNGDVGRNIFGFISAGYTFNESFRLGADFVYGGTKSSDLATLRYRGGEKMETVARASYQYSPKLSFEAWYSYVSTDAKYENGDKNTVRLEANYHF